jgi:hypothetical protein
VYKILNDSVSLAKCTPKKIGDSEKWEMSVHRAEADRLRICKVLDGTSLFLALYGFYSMMLLELKAVAQHGAA